MHLLRRLLFALCATVAALVALALFSGRAAAATGGNGGLPLPGAGHPSTPPLPVSAPASVTTPKTPAAPVTVSTGVTAPTVPSAPAVPPPGTTAGVKATTGPGASAGVQASVTGPGVSAGVQTSVTPPNAGSGKPGASVSVSTSGQSPTGSAQVSVNTAPPPGTQGAKPAAPKGPPEAKPAPAQKAPGVAIPSGSASASPGTQAAATPLRQTGPLTGPVHINGPVSYPGGVPSAPGPGRHLRALPSPVSRGVAAAMRAIALHIPVRVARMQSSTLRILRGHAGTSPALVSRLPSGQSPATVLPRPPWQVWEIRTGQALDTSKHVVDVMGPARSTSQDQPAAPVAPHNPFAAASTAVPGSQRSGVVAGTAKSPQPALPIPFPDLAGGALAGAVTALTGLSSISAVLFLLAGFMLLMWRAVRNRAALLPTSVLLAPPVPPG